ncbi:hypothetical protein ACFQZ1_06335, partial [Bacillus sp. CGMCC 1.60114]|uniref:hypothetical protein n=1 Tax=unclassified Bacillus (in: firmicutes) TaxID=185979 RepID=UPI00363A3007
MGIKNLPLTEVSPYPALTSNKSPISRWRKKQRRSLGITARKSLIGESFPSVWDEEPPRWKFHFIVLLSFFFTQIGRKETTPNNGAVSFLKN